MGQGGVGHENGVKSETGAWAFNQTQCQIASGHGGAHLENGAGLYPSTWALVEKPTGITLGLDEAIPSEVTQWIWALK